MLRSVFAGMLMFGMLFGALFGLSGCGEEESFDVHTLYCRVAGYYVLPSTPDEEKQPLRIGLMGLSKDGKWIEVTNAPVTKNEEDSTVDEAVLTLDEKPSSDIRTEESIKRVKYYKLELRAYLDNNGNGIYDADEPFVDGLLKDNYDMSASRGWVYFFTKDSESEGAKYGYNYYGDTKYEQSFETAKATSTNPRFFVNTYPLANAK